jgi:hypothetical protein
MSLWNEKEDAFHVPFYSCYMVHWSNSPLVHAYELLPSPPFMLAPKSIEANGHILECLLLFTKILNIVGIMHSADVFFIFYGR